MANVFLKYIHMKILLYFLHLKHYSDDVDCCFVAYVMAFSFQMASSILKKGAVTGNRKSMMI